MNWSKDKPNKTGYYWLRNYKFNGEPEFYKKPKVVYVEKFYEIINVSFCADKETIGETFAFGDLKFGEFSEMLEPPK